MEKITLIKLVSKVRNMPPLPQSTTQILKITKDDKSSSKELANVFERDPTLAVNILKLSNSPAYGFTSKISTINQAVVCLGLDTLKSIVLTSATHEMLNKGIPAYSLGEGMLWTHSISSATCARIIAQRIEYKDSEEAYIAGLLLDIGKIILSSFAEKEFSEVSERVRKGKVPFNIAEQELLGFGHAQVGGRIIKKWNLPPALVEAVEYHHQPNKSVTNKSLTYIVHLADAISCMLGIGLGSDGLQYIFEENTLDILGLNKANVESIMSELADKIQIEEGEKFETCVYE
ncbi:MAG: HDOD domain-containing protein [Candidatus Brocadiaceae bacterium]|nr:HDOD domain-containing protein [Candidatus Brocadiaceae bacterium]